MRRYSEFALDGGYMLAEELLSGHQVTLEGFVQDGTTRVIGIVDSVMYVNGVSFQRFDLPSSVSGRVAQRMTVIAERIMRYMGFDDGLFNIELFYDDRTDDVHIVEINPRMCAQFADMMECVNGTNSYEILFAVAMGTEPPPVRPQARYSLASSLVFRHFSDGTVTRAPSEARIDQVKRRFPVTTVRTLYREGHRLSDIGYESDGYSYRYAVVNVAGHQRPSLTRTFDRVGKALGFEIVDDAH